MDITLSAHGSRLVVHAVGAELASFQGADGVERVWTGDAAYWTGQSPVLFPIVGALVENTVRIGGTPYQIGRHGFARLHEFAVTECGEDFVTLTLRDDEATRAQYPFPFALHITHRLFADGFSTTFAVENTGDAPLPFCIGGHPAFRCPAYPGEDFSDYRLEFQKSETADTWVLDQKGVLHSELAHPVLADASVLPLRYCLFDNDALVLTSLRSRRLTLTNGVHGIDFSFEDFPHLGLWTPARKHAPFLCLEPWQGYAALAGESGDYEDKPGLITLAPGKTHACTYRARMF